MIMKMFVKLGEVQHVVAKYQTDSVHANEAVSIVYDTAMSHIRKIMHKRQNQKYCTDFYLGERRKQLH